MMKDARSGQSYLRDKKQKGAGEIQLFFLCRHGYSASTIKS
jgi:hypothetical protein